MNKNFKVLALAGIVALGVAGSGSVYAQKKSKTTKGATPTTPTAAPVAAKKKVLNHLLK
ncbi:hypothetical protein [Pedobacter sp. P26]|uniref:hypothetical protein n=1 Tax=Pedobacter sp. P26 TaxID=3423956 RepID=UPI003D66FD63